MNSRHGLLLPLTLASALALDGANYVVSGVVVDSRSHAPLAHVHVSLAPSTARSQKLEQFTKPDGRFSFAVSQAGKYALQIVKPGYPVQFYQQASFAGLTSAIVVRDDQDTSHIVFQANRGGVITGQIKDEDSEPVNNALVSIFQSLIVGGERKVVSRGQTRANAAGEFRFASLPRGNYYVCAMGRPWFADSVNQLSLSPWPQRAPNEPQPDQSLPKYSPDPAFRGTAFQTTFYPHAQTVEEAALVRVDAGGEAQVSITLPLTKAVFVKGAISFSAEMRNGRANLLKKAYDQYVLFLTTVVSTEGTFEFDNVPAGSYEIVAASDSGAGASSWNARREIEVGASDTEVALRPAPMGSVGGRVLFEADGPPSTSTLFVSLRNEQGILYRSQVDAEGNFSLSRLPAGPYEVTAGSSDYVAAYFAGPSGERLPLTLEITSSEPFRRDLMLTKAVSVIEGTAQRAGMPQAGAFVLLMPKNPAQRWAYRVDQTDSDGSYRLAAIPSGDYFLIALADGAEVAYRDSKIGAKLTSAAKPVHIEAGDRLDLKLEVVGTP
jgi:hypothetical protein